MKTKLNQHALLTPAFANSPKFRVQIRTYRDGVHKRLPGLNDGQQKLLDLALNEAEALAWQTPFPHLFFPTLAEEKARAVTEWRARQEAIRRREMEHSLAA